MTILVTGAAGFIGSATALALLSRGDRVLGIDNLNDYYDPALKHARVERVTREHGDAFRFRHADFADSNALGAAVAGSDVDRNSDDNLFAVEG